jgi:biotin carboxylase
MGITLTKRFRDKLIMRQTAHEAGIRVPAFTPVINYDALRDFMIKVPPPWVLKPRLEAGAMGNRRVANDEELWRLLDQLGDEQSFRVLEQYVPGSVYHVDAINYGGETLFASVQRYGQPPLNVSHDGGIFTTMTVDPESDEATQLRDFNIEVINALGLTDGATHAEFIKGDADGQFYFLEIAARVGGANIADLVEATTGLNPWGEWARLEIALARGKRYSLPEIKQRYGGLLVSLARQEYPDLSGYNDPEVVWRMNKKQHAGLIVASEDAERVETLVKGYSERFLYDFNAVAPARDKPSH